LPQRPGVIFSGLVLNPKGVERAHQAGLRNIEISISASDTHSRKNSGMTLAQATKKGAEMIKLAKKYNMIVRGGIQCAFGCVYEGKISEKRVLELAQEFIKSGIDALALSDTTGMAKPLQVKSILGKLLTHTKDIPVILHLHDTRGLGLVNVMAALECGITHFDTALAGMGGCPFVAGAAGNIATEDTAYLLESLSIETGVNISKITRCTKQLETFFGKQFSGKIHRVL
jgi:hydroxymethylglutaryl-CoA lyase